MALEAGVDQFGGEACPEVIVGLVHDGLVSGERIDVSVRRLLREKFVLGLFDDPYLDPDAAERIVGHLSFQEAGARAQRRAIVLLSNGPSPRGTTLPLPVKLRVYVENVDPETAADYAQVVATVEEADVAILRLDAPYETRGEGFERMFHRGDLSFSAEERARLRAIMDQVPTIVAIHLDRPAVIPELAAHAAAVLADFGASDAAVLDVIFGRYHPSGKLPFELPSSMEAVRQQKEDAPYDSEDPLFPFGHGLTF
jgi:beta-glucosidase